MRMPRVIAVEWLFLGALVIACVGFMLHAGSNLQVGPAAPATSPLTRCQRCSKQFLWARGPRTLCPRCVAVEKAREAAAAYAAP